MGMNSVDEYQGLSEKDVKADIDRRFERIAVEKAFINIMTDVLQAPEDKLESSDCISNIKRYTYEWQVGYKNKEGNRNPSGTIGEVVTRWLGSELLEDFPVFRDFEPGDKENISVENLKERIKRVNVRAFYRDDTRNNQIVVTDWSFNVSEDRLEKRRGELEQEEEKLHQISDSLRDE
jgi:hypothetical protein